MANSRYNTKRKAAKKKSRTDSLKILSDKIDAIDGVVDSGLTLGQFLGLK